MATATSQRNVHPRTWHPLTWVPTLYTAESLPFNAVVLVSAMMYKSFGLSDAKIAFYTSWLLLPWTLKPFFSPFLEMFSTKRRFVLGTQFLAGSGFGVMAFCIPLPFMVQATLALFMIMAFNSAVHDTAADGLYIDALDEKGQAMYVGVQSGFWNVGQVIAQGGFTYMAGLLENNWGVLPAWMVVWGVFGASMAGLALYHALVLPRGRSEQVAKAAPARSLPAVFSGFREVSADFFLKKHAWWLILFSFAYRTAEGQVEKIAQLFMRASVAKGGLGMSTDDVGLAYGAAGTVGMVLGSLVGGAYAAKVGLRRSLLPLALIYNIPNALFTYLAFTQNQSFWVITLCASIEKFSLGMGFVALTLVLMQQLAPGRYTTAHYGFATALMTAGMMVPSMVSGYVSDWLGYQGFFVYLLIMGVPSIAIAMLTPIRENKNVEVGGIDLSAYVTQAEGRAGEHTRHSAWAVAKAAASTYLWVVFSGSVYGDTLSATALVGFSLLAMVCTVLALSGWRSAKVVDQLVRQEGVSGAYLQNRLARGIAGLAVILWLGSVVFVVNSYRDLVRHREACELRADVESCTLVCAAESTARACEVVDLAKSSAMHSDPADVEAAQAAFLAHVALLQDRCFGDEQIAACLELGRMHEGLAPWTLALPEPALEDARRYYNKACRLESAVASSGARAGDRAASGLQPGTHVGCDAAHRLKAVMDLAQAQRKMAQAHN